MHPLFEKASGLTETIIAGSIEVHRDKGAGLIESIYEWCFLPSGDTCSSRPDDSCRIALLRNPALAGAAPWSRRADRGSSRGKRRYEGLVYTDRVVLHLAHADQGMELHVGC